MALFKITRGAESELPSTYHDGYAYFCTDTGSFYIDYKENESSTDIKRMKITAGKADRLTSSTQVGSGTKPVYFKNGIPVECTYELQKTVSSDALFTDEKVKQNADGSTEAEIPILMAGKASPSSGGTDFVKYDTEITINPAENSITATKFVGNLEGGADRLIGDAGKNGQTGSSTLPVYFENGVPKATTYQLNATVPSDAKFTDTDTKVTSVSNHYTPAANNASQLSADAANGSSATWNSTNFVTGVNLQRDAKGHVVGVTVDSAKMPANPNVDTNTAHEHAAGVGLAIEGTDNILSGEVKYKAKLKNETPLTVDSVAPTSVGGTYPIVADKSGNLAVSAPNATISAKGVVQLTSEIDTSENKAATPKAVKTAYDLADTIKTNLESLKISETYETKTDASTKLTEAKEYAKEYTDGKISLIMENADDITLNSIKELSEAIEENDDAIEALNSIAASKADATTVNNHINNKNNPHSVTCSQIGAAPTSHASTATTYGKGTKDNYGHVKLSSATDSTSSTSDGVAATPAAVKAAYDLAASANSAAGNIDEKLSGYKTTQTAVSDPATNGTSAEFISSITQNANGVISATKKTVLDATTSVKGIVKLTDSTSSTSTTTAATPAAVKQAYDLANTAKSAAESIDNKLSGYKTTQTAVSSPSPSTTTTTSFIDTISQNTNGVISATKKPITTATTSTAGIIKLSSSTSSTSEALAATPKAVKAAYDLANTVKSNLEGLTITANASDDDVIVLTGQGGVHSVSYSASHAVSGVTAGDYTKVSVNDKGHVTSGSNPKSLGGYGITDAYTKTEIDTELNNIDGQLSSINSELDGSIKSLSVSGKVITYTKNDGSTGTITTQDTNTDTKVTQNAVITTAKNYPIILGYSDATTKVTNVVNKASDLTYNPSTGILTAPTFKGNLDGIAETAEYANEAGKAIKDGSDRNIVSTYETKEDASNKLEEANKYTNDAIALVMNNSSEAVDSIMELADAMANNETVVDALEEAIGKKADATTVNNHIANKNNPHGVTYTQVGAAPTNHASTGTTYGTGTNNNYGHVKLSDSVNSSSSTSGGIAATPKAVNTAYELADTAKTKADSAYTLAEGKVDSLSDLGITATATELNYVDDVTSNIQTQLNDKVSKSSTAVQAIAGGLVVGKTSASGVSATGIGRIMFTGQGNPLIGVQAVDGTTNKTPYYIQSVASDDSLYIGPTSARALKFDSDGNMTSPANLSIIGNISEGNQLLSAKYAANSVFTKSGSGAKAGLVPAPSTTAGTTKYLREDGTWVVPPNTTYNPATSTVSGRVTLSDSVTSESNASQSVAATPKAVKMAYDLANTAKTAAENVDSKLSGYKTTQTPVTDPTASSTSSTFIATITQDANGKITATKKTVSSGTTSAAGIVKLSSSTNSTSETLAATPKAVKAAYDLAASAESLAGAKPGSDHKHSVSHTPAGTISAPTFTSTTTSTGNNTTIDAPTLTASINNKCLTITFTTGSYAHTHNLNITGTISAPTFTGTAATLTTSAAINN